MERIPEFVGVSFPLFFVIMCLYPLPHIVTGPNAKGGFQMIFEELADHWWHLALQIRNFYEYNISNLLIHTWFLSVDFQLFLVALPTLLILKGRKSALVTAFCALSLLGCAIGTWVVARHELQPMNVFPSANTHLMEKTFNEYYIRPYYHAAAYFSGCMTFLLMGDFRKKKLTKGMQLLGWCVSVGCGLTSVFWKLPWYRSVSPTSVTTSLFVAFFDRILWSVFLVWLTLCFASGRGGYASKFLSWNVFVPLSKLTFGVYIIHMPFIQLMLYASRERVVLSRFNMVTLWFSVLVWNYLLSYLVYIACEAPITKLSNLICGRILGRAETRVQNARTAGIVCVKV
ncbi:hypothetical protein HPB50_020036 [Hyalomma asiaticum]|uniref:Uncharacterized protein n=1 Tax=Hyalomma asiaticum TaxID=266040 RepID=A0ACB7SK22_HYAAI|nr:hypothetical protein HPB50_020036 [Hyalomma asiaticum]